MSYQAPVKDMMFNLRHVAGLDAVAQLPGFEDFGDETAQAVLEECAKLMQDVIRLVAAVKVAPFDLIAAQTFAKLRATVAVEADTDDVMIAAIALSNELTLVTRRAGTFARYPHLRVEDWTV